MIVPAPRPEAALLFDLDGTLVDTWEVNFLSYRDALREADIACPRSAFAHHFGEHWRTFLPQLSGTTDLDLLQRIHRRKQDLYRDHLVHARLNENLARLLQGGRGHRSTGLVTTASRANVEILLGHFQLTDCFDCIITGDDVKNSKPAPDGYLACLGILGASADASIAFEDSPTGIAAARAAGLAVVVVEDFQRPAADNARQPHAILAS